MMPADWPYVVSVTCQRHKRGPSKVNADQEHNECICTFVKKKKLRPEEILIQYFRCDRSRRRFLFEQQKRKNC